MSDLGGKFAGGCMQLPMSRDFAPQARDDDSGRWDGNEVLSDVVEQ